MFLSNHQAANLIHVINVYDLMLLVIDQIFVRRYHFHFPNE